MPKLLIIGFDGGTWNILLPLIEKGKMPTLKRLMDEGKWGTLLSTDPPLTPPAWTTFQTGVSPKEHGILDFVLYNPESYYEPIFFNSTLIRHKTLWEILNENQISVISIGLPGTYPPPKIKNAVVSDLLTPSLKSDFIYPKELKKEFLEKFPQYKFVVDQGEIIQSSLSKFIQKLIEVERQRVNVFNFLYKKFPETQVGFVQFQSIDNLQHALYPFIDPKDEEFSKSIWEKASQFYQSIDENIKNLLEIFKPSHVIVLSDHGFGKTKGIVYLNKIFERKKLLKRKETLKSFLIDSLKKIDIFQLRKKIFSRETREKMLSDVNKKRIDWKKTFVFMHSGSQGANICFNLGILKKEEVEKFSFEVKKILENISNPFTEEKIVKKIYFKKDISSPYAPDLFVSANDGYVFSRSFTSKNWFEKLYGLKNPNRGYHYKEGVFVIKNFPSQPTKIEEIPKLILELFKIKKEKFFLNKKTKKEIREKKDEREEIEKRLKSLGYF